MFVLGIDPGVARCGYAVLRPRRPEPAAAAIGVIRTGADQQLSERLATLSAELAALFDEFVPEVLAIERVLFQVNTATAMSVGMASGLALAEAGRRSIPVFEYSPNQVKATVAGYGNATKQQMQHMVQASLKLPVRPEPPDAADAAAVAMCHIAHSGVSAAVEERSRT